MDLCSSLKTSHTFTFVLAALMFWCPRDLAAQQQINPFEAIANQKQADLLAYLTAGGDPNAADSWGTLLEQAAHDNQLDSVAMLLQHRADPNTHFGAALRTASELGYLDVAKELLSHG